MQAASEPIRKAGEAAIRQRFKRAIAEGDVPADANAADFARYVATIMYGLAVQGSGRRKPC